MSAKFRTGGRTNVCVRQMSGCPLKIAPLVHQAKRKSSICCLRFRHGVFGKCLHFFDPTINQFTYNLLLECLAPNYSTQVSLILSCDYYSCISKLLLSIIQIKETTSSIVSATAVHITMTMQYHSWLNFLSFILS